MKGRRFQKGDTVQHINNPNYTGVVTKTKYVARAGFGFGDFQWLWLDGSNNPCEFTSENFIKLEPEVTNVKKSVDFYDISKSCQVLTYGLFYDKTRLQWTIIEATKYDELTNAPISWAVRNGRDAMSKNTGVFDYEPMPSSRDDEYYTEYRFNTPEEAAQCWSKFHS